MKIKRHKLVGINYKRSPNQSGIITPKYLVVHYTAGRGFEASLQTLTRRSSKASAHVLIGRDGEIVQMVNFNRRAWHAGKSKWKNLVGLNGHSIGIELDNYGKLTKTADGGWKTWFGRPVDPSEVIIAKHKNGGPLCGWHTYSEKQMEKLEEIGEVLFEKYDLQDVLGHDMISPNRKQDPGPAFKMNSFKSLMLGRENEELCWEPEPEIEVPEFLNFDPNNFVKAVL